MSNRSLPEGWTMTRLEGVALRFISGGTPASKQIEYWDGDIPWTTSAPIGSDDLRLTKAQRYISQSGLQYSASNLVPCGSVLVGTRVGVGKAVVNELDIAISQDLTGIVFDKNRIDAEFVVYQFKTRTAQSFIEGRKRGTTIQGISRFDLEELTLHIPPLPEQHAIAAILRAVQDAREARCHELALERERKAALMEELFKCGMRGEPCKQTEIGRIPQSWEVVRLDAVFQTQLGKMLSQKAKVGDDPKPYLRNANVQWGRVEVHDLYTMDFSEKEAAKFRLRCGDVLVCEGGEIGRTAIWKDEIEECYFQKAIHRLRPCNNLMDSEFFMHFMEWAFRLTNLYGTAGTQTTIAHLPQEKLNAMLLPKPRQDEQCDIAEVLTACDQKVAALEAEAALHDELFRALLEELMTGRISTQSMNK